MQCMRPVINSAKVNALCMDEMDRLIFFLFNLLVCKGNLFAVKVNKHLFGLDPLFKWMSGLHYRTLTSTCNFVGNFILFFCVTRERLSVLPSHKENQCTESCGGYAVCVTLFEQGEGSKGSQGWLNYNRSFTTLAQKS